MSFSGVGCRQPDTPDASAPTSPVPIRYEILPDLVHVEITGMMSATEIFEFYGQVGSNPAFRPGMPFLVDARAVTEAAPFPEMRTTAIGATHSPVFSVPTKSAALVSSPWMYGLVRQWAAISSDSPLVTHPFFDVDTAMAWLRSPSADDPLSEEPKR